VSGHLHYEVGMLQAVARGLASGAVSGSPTHNALLESFAIHVRNLVDFLWPEKPKNDHVVAADFFSSPQDWTKNVPAIPHQLRAARIRAAKEVAHLTYARLLVTAETKGWSYVHLADEIIKAFKVFLQNVPSENLGEEWKGLK
jgi:hypothetical protein